MEIFKKIHKYAHTLLGIIDKAALLGMIFVVSLEVFGRMFNKGFGWSNEVSLMLLLWFTFLSMVQGVNEKLHISLNILYDHVPPKVQIVIEKISILGVLIVGIILFYYGILLCKNTMSSFMPATQLPSGVRYMVIPISGFMISLDSIVFLFQKREAI